MLSFPQLFAALFGNRNLKAPDDRKKQLIQCHGLTVASRPAASLASGAYNTGLNGAQGALDWGRELRDPILPHDHILLQVESSLW